MRRFIGAFINRQDAKDTAKGRYFALRERPQSKKATTLSNTRTTGEAFSFAVNPAKEKLLIRAFLALLPLWRFILRKTNLICGIGLLWIEKETMQCYEILEIPVSLGLTVADRDYSVLRRAFPGSRRSGRWRSYYSLREFGTDITFVSRRPPGAAEQENAR